MIVHSSPASTRSSFKLKLQPGLKLQTTSCNQPIRSMASGQEFKGDRAEAAAKLAAKDIGDINRQNERDENFDLHSETNFRQARAEAAAKLAAKDLEDVNRMRDHTHSTTTFKEQRYDENRPGVIGSMFRAAKEAVVGKPHTVETSLSGNDSNRERVTKEQGGSKMGEYADYSTQKAKERKDERMQKAGEYTDFPTQKAKESKDYAERIKEAKDATLQKAAEYKDYTAEKAKEEKDSATGKLGELKDSAADAAKRAMGFFTGTRDETKVNINFQYLFYVFVDYLFIAASLKR